MSDPIIYSYQVTSANVQVQGTPKATFNSNSGKVQIDFTHLINSFSAGSWAVKYRIKVTALGAWTGWANAYISGATTGTNGGVLKAKNRKVSNHLTWETFKNLLPQNYADCQIKVTLTDSGSNSFDQTIDLGALDLRMNIVNKK